MTPSRPLPVDFAAWAPAETNAQLRDRYRASPDTIIRWREESGIPTPGRAYKRVPPPAGFRLLAATMCVRQLSAHLGRSRDLVKRWCRDLGIEPILSRPGRIAKVPEKPRANAAAAPFRSSMHAPVAVTRHERDMSDAGQAADYLRQFSAIWRCNERGVATVGGSHWRRGNGVLTDAELIERAEYMRRTRAPATSIINHEGARQHGG